MFQCYKRILQLDPVNIQGLHNLCVVYVERGKLLQAQACLKHAHQLAPGEDYVLRHLQIVTNRISKLKNTDSIQYQIAFQDFDPAEFGGSRRNTKYEDDKTRVTHNQSASPQLTTPNRPMKMSERSDEQSFYDEPIFMDELSQKTSAAVGGIHQTDHPSATFYTSNNYQITQQSGLVASDLDDPSSGMS